AEREEIADRNLEGNREDVEPGEDVFSIRFSRPLDFGEIISAQVDQVEDALLVQLIRIVELARDHARAAYERVNFGVDEILIVESPLAARWIPRVVPLERSQAVNEPIGLGAVVVRKDREAGAQNRGV